MHILQNLGLRWAKVERFWKKPQEEGEKLRNLKKLQKGSAGETMMDAHRNEIFKHSIKRKKAPEKLNWGREEMLKYFTCEKLSNYERNLLGTYIFLTIFSILSIENLPREATVNIQCQENG